MDFALQQAVVTVEVEKYDEDALIDALKRYVLGGEVVKAPTLKSKPSSAEKSTKASEGKKSDPDRYTEVIPVLPAKHR